MKRILILFLLMACDSKESSKGNSANIEKSPPITTVALSPAAWVGDWVMGDRILATDKDGQLELMQSGEVVMSGPMSGEGLHRSAPLDGCSAKLTLSGVGGDITMVLSGPECAIEFAGTYINTVSP